MGCDMRKGLIRKLEAVTARDNGALLREIGARYGVGPERARQLIFAGELINRGRLRQPYMAECLSSIAGDDGQAP